MASAPMPKDEMSAENALRLEIAEELPDGAGWLASPNRRLCGRTPEEAIRAGDLDTVRNLVHSILYVGVM